MNFSVTEDEAKFTLGPFLFMGVLVSFLALPLLAICTVHILGFLGFVEEKADNQTGWPLMIFFSLLTWGVVDVYGRILSRSTFKFDRSSGDFHLNTWKWGRTKQERIPKSNLNHLEVLEHGNPLSHGPYLKLELHRNHGEPIVFHHLIPYMAPHEIKEAHSFLDAIGIPVKKTVRHDKNRIDKVLEKVGRTS